jgi:hypothetical protein
MEVKNLRKYQKLIESCIEKGVNLNEVRLVKPKQSLLEAAVSGDNLFLVKLLLNKGADSSKVFEYAAMQLDEDSKGEIFIWLVEQGADLNIKGVLGDTPFLIVVKSGNSNLIEYCLKNGAKCDSLEQRKKAINAAQNSINSEAVLQVLSNYWNSL